MLVNVALPTEGRGGCLPPPTPLRRRFCVRQFGIDALLQRFGIGLALWRLASAIQ